MWRSLQSYMNSFITVDNMVVIVRDKFWVIYHCAINQKDTFNHTLKLGALSVTKTITVTQAFYPLFCRSPIERVNKSVELTEISQQCGGYKPRHGYLLSTTAPGSFSGIDSAISCSTRCTTRSSSLEFITFVWATCMIAFGWTKPTFDLE